MRILNETTQLMISYYTEFLKRLENSKVGYNWQSFYQDVTNSIKNVRHGDVPKWNTVINELPEIVPSSVDLGLDAVRIGDAKDATKEQLHSLKEKLISLYPWRKGPWNVFGIEIDSEWRDELKWNRIKNHIDLTGKTVLDIGANNGYFTCRMKGAGSELVLGVELYILYVMQFHAINKYIQSTDVSVLPIGVEHIPYSLHCFDVIFSMGVLYHRKDPQEHLRHIKSMLAPDGVCVLESIVIDDSEGDVLIPKNRYAKMNNVSYIPSVSTGKQWLTDAGFSFVEVVNVSVTTIKEQRTTEWMHFDSLNNFLNATDTTKTVEGHPAPKRAIYIAYV